MEVFKAENCNIEILQPNEDMLKLANRVMDQNEMILKAVLNMSASIKQGDNNEYKNKT